LQPPQSRIARVRISEQRWFRNDSRIAKWYGPYRQRIHTPQHSPFQLFDKGSNNARQIAVIDKQSGMLVGHVEVPPGSRYSNRSTTAHVGHFFPLGSRSALSGISLLEYQTVKPLWTITPKQHGLQREPMRVGPAGPSFCTFQSRRQLLVVEPANGRTLWQRTDLDSNDGTLLGSSEFSFFGDDEVLVLLSSNDSKYVVYRTATGEELRRGQLDIDSRRQRRAFGRKLFYVSSSPAGRRLQIWDPLSDRLVFDRPVSGHIFSAATPDNELVLAIPPDGVLILDVVTGETRLDFKLDPSDFAKLNHVRAFRDHGRYYVNFERSVRVPHLRKYSDHASDTLLPVMHMQGDLYAVDRETGKLLWKRTIPPRSIIRTPHLRLPFLVGMSRVGNRTNGRRSLLVEVIDSSTGDTIGFKENIFPDRLVQLSYDPAVGRIELRGLKTLIDLDFSRKPLQILLDGPL
jgi:outer membrane protein assembly factor BamB